MPTVTLGALTRSQADRYPERLMSVARRIFGDVQTPPALAQTVCRWLAEQGVGPASVLEPTCGVGAFVRAAETQWPQCDCLALELNPEHLAEAQAHALRTRFEQADAFEVDWNAQVALLPGPTLLLGNPPWSTTGVQGRDGGARNRPKRAEGPKGLDGITGASNFDVSEWLLRRWLEALRPNDALAMLIKSSVARRLRDWATGVAIETVGFDAQTAFDAAVDAVLFFARKCEPQKEDRALHLHRAGFDAPAQELQHRFGAWVRADRPLSEDVIGPPQASSPWRSGVKHDCSRLFELRPQEDGRFSSALESDLTLEPESVYPLLKSTDLARGRAPSRSLLLTQRALSEPPDLLAKRCPEAWAYLLRHQGAADARKSRVYRGRPSFAQFGVGDYSLSSYKVAVSGLHWPPRFCPVGPVNERPVLFDDTCYFLPCAGRDHAESLAGWLNSDGVVQNLSAFTDPRAKRPITKGLLSRLRLPSDSHENGSH
ncbi:MAG: class I SAM-dependent methyltransferase [Myxococcota bacterium]